MWLEAKTDLSHTVAWKQDMFCPVPAVAAGEAAAVQLCKLRTQRGYDCVALLKPPDLLWFLSVVDQPQSLAAFI